MTSDRFKSRSGVSLLLGLEGFADTYETIGAIVSIVMDLLELMLPEAPGDGSATLAIFPATSLIDDPAISAAVEAYSSKALLSLMPTVYLKTSVSVPEPDT